jgi:hypothetical protein
MLRRIRQHTLRSFGAALVVGSLLAAPLALAQDDNGYQQPPKVAEGDVALAFLAGRYTTPVTCKKTDGSVIELEDSISMKPAPDSAGGGGLKVTFFGVDVADVAYCYNLVERRVIDRRGTIFIHFRAYTRKDLGMADFRRAAAAGPLTYNAHRGELQARGIGTDADPAEARVLPFDGGDSKVVVTGIPAGSDGAKLLADYDARVGRPRSSEGRRLMFRFTAKDGTEFTFYGVEAAKPRK